MYGEREVSYRNFVGNLKERNYYRGLVIDWREMLERI
jgi:hypothetical protein